eukprot:scaffold90569_cov15-Tisochrysis_lutea.AAC.1
MSWPTGGAGPSSVLNHEEFPELPTMSKAAKKKMRQQVGLPTSSSQGPFPASLASECVVCRAQDCHCVGSF